MFTRTTKTKFHYKLTFENCDVKCFCILIDLDITHISKIKIKCACMGT
jgi:hypothetical protein